MVSFLLAILVAAANIAAALAALYPTTPVSGTVYRAGSGELVTWVDNDRKPRLRDLGPLDIKLCTADGAYVSTLERNVEPHSRRRMVNIPLNLPSGSPEYVLHFTSMNPATTIYTANFSITTYSPPTPVLAHIQTTTTGPSPTDTRAHAYLTLVLPNATITSQVVLGPTDRGDPEATIYAEPLMKTTSSKFNSAVHSAARGAHTRLQKGNFPFMSILWPALVGISMAL